MGQLWWRFGLCLLGLTVFLLYQADPIFLLTWGPANTALGLALALYLGWKPIQLLLIMDRWWSLTLALLFFPVLMLFSLLVLLSLFMIGREQVDEFGWHGTRVKAYLINGGATTAYMLELRQERDIAPGLVLVKDLGIFYDCDGAKIEPTSEGIRLSYAAIPNSDCRIGPAGKEIRLRRFVYF